MVLVCVEEYRNYGQGNVLAACEPLGDVGWDPYLQAHRGPHPGVGQEECSPISADPHERDDLLSVFFGTVINDKIEDPRQNLRGKSVRRRAFV